MSLNHFITLLRPVIIILPILSISIVLNNSELKSEQALATSLNNSHVSHFNVPVALEKSSVFYTISEAATVRLKINHNTGANVKTTQVNNDSIADTNHTAKLAILTFGDIHKNQFTVVKPILDKYGFKGSFFVTCGFVKDNNAKNIGMNNGKENGTPRMSWSDIEALKQDGQDIESKGMTHRDLNQLGAKDLEFEIGGSKHCLESHNISPNIFAVVHGDAWNNSSVIKIISKYYGFADNGFADLIFLRCDGYITHKQTDCSTYTNNGTLNYANRYSIRERSQNTLDRTYLHNDSLLFEKFKEQINSQTGYNNMKGFIDAIPVIAYHSIDDSKGPSSTDVELFASEMKYLYDNGIKVIPMSDLGYNESTNYIYVKTG